MPALAAASQDEVLRQWQGLGYYSRARNLHEAVQEVQAKYGGHVPENKKDVQVSSITTDSRQAAKGCLFVAIPGERVDGHDFIPSANHAGGLRYHGMSPALSKLYADGLMEARSYEQTAVFEAATLFARTEGTLPAPESAHAIKGAIDEALKCKETGEEKTIVFGLTGTGYFDMTAYQKYNDGDMSDYIPTDADLEKGFSSIPA